MIHLAMFESINTITDDYFGYGVSEVSQVLASPIAAGAKAAYDVAVSLYPNPREKAVWDATLQEALGAIK